MYIMEYYSTIKKKRNWVICRDVDMDLETVIQSEVSQKEENKCILMQTCEKWYRRPYLQNRERDTDIENKRNEHQGVGEGGWDEVRYSD